MSHSKTLNKTEPARAKSAKRPARYTGRPGNTASAASQGRTKQEAVLTLLRQPKGATITAIMKATVDPRAGPLTRPLDVGAMSENRVQHRISCGPRRDSTFHLRL